MPIFTNSRYIRRVCAVGRLITDKNLCHKLDTSHIEYGGTSVKCIFNALPIEIQELGIDFLTRLQGLHDSSEYWDENGVSEEGSYEVESIKNKYINN